jgi:SIR2-like domain
MTTAETAFGGPYRGLEPFDEEAAAFFFGRERESRLIIASLFATPLTLLYGSSGVGKSSVLRAGVLPRLRRDPEALPVLFPRLASGGNRSTTIERGWQTDPVSGIKETMALALFALAGDDTGWRREYQDVVRRHDMTPLAGFTRACAEVSKRRILVILDQFEEYSLYHPTDDLFAAQLPEAVSPASGPFSFLVSLREDSLARLDRFKRTIPNLWDNYRRIDHLSRAAATDAIRQPLAEYNRRAPAGTPSVAIEDSLVHAVLDEVRTGGSLGFGQRGGASTNDEGRERIETPYLQLVMTRLWEREREVESPLLRRGTFLSEGGAREIVRTHLDRVMDQFSDEERDLAARVFHRLVTPSGAKISFTVRDLAQYEAVEEDALAPILRRLEEGTRRILRRVVVAGEAENEPRYEIFHDRLGEAILAWRAKRLAEQAREADLRKQQEQKRLLSESRSRLEAQVQAAMEHLGPEGQQTWVAVMFFLVASNGARHSQSVEGLARHAERPLAAVQRMMMTLLMKGIVRHSFQADDVFEVVNDDMASALLEWHSRYVQRGGVAIAGAPRDDVRPAAHDLSNTFPYGVVRGLMRERRVMPFLGAGVGASARKADRAPSGEPGLFLPTSRELKELLAKECEFPPSEFEASDLAEVASFLVQRTGRRYLDEVLQRVLGGSHFVLSDTHRMLAETARQHPMTILTTNYDTLMERALADAGVAFDVLSYRLTQDTLGGLLLVSHGGSASVLQRPGDFEPHPDRTLLIRLHGGALVGGEPQDSYVLTEEDHIDWILWIQSRVPPPILRQLANSHLLSLGHSARDWSQRALLRLLLTGERLTRWAVALRPSPLSIMTWQRYEVQVFNQDLNDWTASMRAAPLPGR